MKLLDLFAGIGGFSLAAHSLGMDTLAFCECEPYPTRVLNRHFPGVPVFPDVKELTADALADAERAGLNRRQECHRQSSGASEGADEPRRAHADGCAASEWRPESVVCCGLGEAREAPAEALILTAGFPCQDLSYAGKGAGLEGERSGLYGEVIRIVRELRPEWVLLENVSAILTRGVGTVLGELASCGYGWAYGCVPACAVGAPHRRDRWWAVAWPTLGDEEDRRRGERIWSSVLTGITPFGDLAEGWPTATASDAWAGDHNRSQVIPCNGRVLTGKAGLGLGQAARGELWRSPTAAECKNQDYSAQVYLQNQAGARGAARGETWPTPNKMDAQGHGTTGGGHHQHDIDRCYLRGVAVPPDAVGQGSLNPDWVDALMGYPIGYTLPEGEPLLYLPGEWPDGAPDGLWFTPAASDGTSGAVISERDTYRETASGRPRKVTGNGTDGSIGLGRAFQVWPAGLGAPQHEWEPPRLTSVKENRASRLKALGNSIVPAVALLWLRAIQEEASR